MQEDIIDRLRRLNREFYQTFAGSFAETRARLQPGVLRTLEGISDNESVLDLGCGNGEVAQDLHRRGHQAVYFGLDSCLPLLDLARDGCLHPNANFVNADLAEPGWTDGIPTSFDQIFAFAVLHHTPSIGIRTQLLRQVNDVLSPGGTLTLSNWNFIESPRLRARVLPWDTIGIRLEDVDPGDTLLDWKRGGRGLRYVHHFSEEELGDLAQSTGYRVTDIFYSDGEGGRLGHYQVWKKK